MHATLDVDGVLADRWLLDHPYYRRWQDGGLREGELAAYAAQYAHWERQLPRTLGALCEAAGPGPVRDAMAANLDDELGVPEPHVELLDGFCAAVGATGDDPTPATAALVALYRDATARSVGYAVGVVAAYEVQSGGIAITKGESLREHYGLDARATRFWDVHAELERHHADWTIAAAGEVDRDELLEGMAASRDAWWAFLDEREAAFAA